MMICWDMVHARLYGNGRPDRFAAGLLGLARPQPGNIPLFGIRDWMSRQPAQRPLQLAEKLNVPVVYCNMTGAFTTRVPAWALPTAPRSREFLDRRRAR